MSGGGGAGGGGGGGAVNPTRCNEKPWDLWVSEMGRASPRRDRSAERKEARRRRRAGVGLLRRDAMPLHGLHPQSDELNAVVCHMCGAAVKCSAAYRHLLERHSAAAEPLLPPPPPLLTTKPRLPKSRAPSRRERPPTPPRPEAPIETPTMTVAPPKTSPIIPRITQPNPEVYYTEQEALSKPVVQSDVQVCVDGELPVVSIQDTEDLRLGEHITDDILAIMSSEGIQSADDQDSTSWKNIIRDIGSIQEISFPQTDAVATQEIYVDQLSLPAYTLPEDLSSIQFKQSALPAVLDQVALNPAPQPPTPSRNSRSKPSKTKFNSREYDPNKHCGVITPETQKPCTRSLTCKAHTLSLRRTVEGRVKPFDTLLAEHKAAREASANTTTPVVTPAPAPPPPPAPVSVPIPPSLLVSPAIDISSLNMITLDPQGSDMYSSLLNPDDTSVLPDTSSLTSLLSQPLPTDQFLLPEDPVLSGEVPILSIASPVDEPETPTSISQSAAKPETINIDSTPTIVLSDVCWYPTMPRPLAVCTFNASQAGGAVVLGKKFATVRSNIKSTFRSQGKTVASSTNSYYNFSQNSMTSLSKTVHMNNATKCSKPEVRKLIVTSPAMCGVKTEPSYSEVDFSSSSSGVRHNGHITSSKRSALDSDDCDGKRSRQSVLRNNVKVAKHMGQGDMLELSFMFDPLMADEKC